MAVEPTGVPDIIIKKLIQDGIAAFSANLTLFDGVWRGLDADDIARLKAFWAGHPPTVLTGFARRTDPFPVFAVTLASDDTDTTLLDDGEFFDEDEDDTIGREVTRSTFRIWVFAENPDVCAAYYRALRRILQVGKRRLESRGLLNPVLSGSELAPDPSYTPDNVFTRQVTLTVIFEESWSMDPASDDLAAALLPPQPDRLSEGARLSPTSGLNIAHEDSGGEVHPDFDDEE